MEKSVKMTLNITQDNFVAIEEISKDTGMNKTDVINKAIVIEKFFNDVKKKDQKVLIQSEDGSLREVIFR